jgi:hypothetical protein
MREVMMLIIMDISVVVKKALLDVKCLESLEVEVGVILGRNDFDE